MLKSIKSFKLDDLEHPEEDVWPEDRLYRYQYQSREQYGDQKWWTNNFIWSKNTYWLDQFENDSDNCVLHYVQDRPDRAYVCEELMHISENNPVPVERLSKCN